MARTGPALRHEPALDHRPLGQLDSIQPDSHSLEQLELAQHWVLTQDDWPLEVALHGQLIRSRGGAGALEWGPLFQAELGRIRTGLNLVLEHDFNSPRPKPTELKLQWQLSYRMQPGLRLGLQGFSELGPWQNWLPAEQQSHRAGPALFQSIDLGAGQSLALQLAWLEGKTFGRSGSMLSARAAYSF